MYYFSALYLKKKHSEVERAASLALIYHQINKII
jgi:hypothetical protein